MDDSMLWLQRCNLEDSMVKDREISADRGLLQSLAGRRDSLVALIADDEAIMREVLRAVLQTMGFLVFTARDGEEALRLSREFPGAIEILVSDIMMPNLDGIALSAQILRERPTVKVLLMSGYADKASPTVPMLHKPFRLGVFKERVLEMLGVEQL